MKYTEEEAYELRVVMKAASPATVEVQVVIPTLLLMVLQAM